MSPSMSKAQFHVAVITQIIKSVFNVTLKHNINFWCSKMQIHILSLM